MRWIHDYQLFLFDFDGLLVNTEEIHFAAYRQLCKNHGYDLDWTFPQYCLAAHYSAEGLRDQIYAKFPALNEQYPDWSVLYKEKKQIYLDLLASQSVNLMAGVENLLKSLQDAGINRCVVTHSASEQVNSIRDKNPVLNTIPNWITREDYSEPKPSPECYQLAIERLASTEDRVIGFEDSPRGLKALAGTRAIPILVCPVEHPAVRESCLPSARYFATLEDISQDQLPS